jgi:NAD(P)-dependent dehydrogenase (short-subunit alcohol dehydrogenase family)
VNNAGIGNLGFLHTFDESEMLEIFDVNVFGPHRISNAFGELLIASQGRVVNIGSQGGTLSKKLFGPYSMTKHALEAYTVALAEELAPHGVRVSIVQPGGVETRIGETSMPSTLARLRRAGERFRPEAEQIIAALEEPPDTDESAPESEANRRPSPPEVVARAVEHALFSPEPRERYLVGTRWEGDRVIHTLIDRLLDANECPELGYSRDQLVGFIDEHLADRSSGRASPLSGAA